METETLHSCDLCGSGEILTIDSQISLCECHSCGYIFDNPRPAHREIVNFYSMPTKYDLWLAEERGRDLLWLRRLKKMKKSRRCGALFDVGTGIGQFLHHAKALYTDVQGTEISASAISIARKKYGLQIAQAAMEDLQVGDSSFGTITLFHVLEHVPRPKALIQKCYRLLQKDGILVIAVPNDVLWLRGMIKAFLKKIGVKRYADCGRFGLRRIKLDGTMDEIHVSHFTPDVLKRFLQATGFSVLENTLDPYYALTGIKKMGANVYYATCLVLKYLVGVNIYDTIWIVAKK
jgi:ubiquinone/menaquinone biosynthesis C-methylase UbiE